MNTRIVSIESAEHLRGFKLVESWAPSDKKGTRPGFVRVPMLVGENPGDGFEFTFEGRAVGLWVAAGPDAGVVEYAVDGDRWKTVDTFTAWSAGLHLPWVHMLETELDMGMHTLRLRIAAEKNPNSAGHALRIAHFLVNR